MTSLQSLWFLPQRRLIMAKPSKNRTRKIVDVKAVAANDTQPAVEAPVAETPAATKVVQPHLRNPRALPLPDWEPTMPD